VPPVADATATPASPMNVYSLQLTSLDGKPVDMTQYRGKVTLLVNVASECGYTPQYAGLQALHAELKDQGFAVLGFPCNDFGSQEPGTAEQIQQFCTTKYSVAFPLFAKLQTKAGANQSPLYAMLGEATGKLPTWNFCKYVVGKDGKVVQFFGAGTKPDSKELRDAITKAMG
jgi:glutathione peroxidase